MNEPADSAQRPPRHRRPTPVFIWVVTLGVLGVWGLLGVWGYVARTRPTVPPPGVGTCPFIVGSHLQCDPTTAAIYTRRMDGRIIYPDGAALLPNGIYTTAPAQLKSVDLCVGVGSCRVDSYDLDWAALSAVGFNE